jgi:hypothetical protein
MIYKLHSINTNTILEVKQSDPSEVSFSIYDGSVYLGEVELDYVDLFKLIGALHLLQKDLKGGKNGN